MSLLSKLFGGGGGKPQAEPEVYKGFRIIAEPKSEGGKYRIGARIEMDAGDEVLTHTLIRADMLDTLESAVEASAAKARQVIDEQGEALFR